MKHSILKMTMSALVAGAIGALSASCGGQSSGTNVSQPHFAGQAPGEAQAILRRLEGTVTAVDSKAMTLTIKSADGDHAFKTSSKTKFNRAGKPASLSDAVVGQSVEVVIKMVYGQRDEIITVNIKSQ